MKTKSLKKNAVLNAARNILTIIFPFITFPYATKVLQVENIGKVNFASSILSYFILIAGLGIANYAVREGAGLRDRKDDFTRFSNEIFTINMIASVISYIALYVSISLVPKLRGYRMLFLLLSIEIIFVTIGMEWIFTIYEDYLFITIRSIIFQLISFVLLFTLVRSKEDYLKYALIAVIAGAGGNILNFIFARKYCKVGFTLHINWRKHLKPILVIFSIALTTTIYVSSDMTMLGFMAGDYYVGLYSVGAKIYRIVKNVLGALLIVSVPRISYYYIQKRDRELLHTLSDIFNALVFLLLPSVTGLIVLSKEIVLIISGEKFIEATGSMAILSVSLIFCLFAWFYSQCILMPFRYEKTILYVTIFSAILNVALNFALIPIWKHYAAALSTAVAEAVTMGICIYKSRKFIRLIGVVHNLVSSVAGCLGIVLVSLVLKRVVTDTILCTIVTVLAGVLTYIIIQILMKNDFVFIYIKKLRNRIKKTRLKEPAAYE